MKERVKRGFSRENIRSFAVMDEKLYVELKIPVKLLSENQDMFESYKGYLFKQPTVGRLYQELKADYGIEMPLNFDWETFITENKILFTSKPDVRGYTNVDKVRHFKIVENDVCLECIVSNPAYDPNKKQLIKNSRNKKH
jgi:hypothetical protein